MRTLPAVTLALLVGCTCTPEPEEPRAPRDTSARPPNLVLILTDDQRHDAFGAGGSAFLETPRLDSLAEQGVLFEQAVVPTALCCPSRASLLTGQYPHRTGVYNNWPEAGALDDQRLFPEDLQDAGYATAYVGKWHLPNPGAEPVRGFDHWVSFEGQGEYWNQPLNVDGEAVDTSGYSTDVLTRYAVDWIEKRHDRPFFLMLSLKNCHKPYEAPERHRGKLAGVELALPASAEDPDVPRWVQLWRDRPGERPQQVEDGTILESVRGYYELVYAVDECVGAVVDALRGQHLLEDTCIVFTSDHGMLWGEHGLYQKRVTYDPAIRVPLIVRHPAHFPAGLRTPNLVTTLDISATLLHLAGAARSPLLQGRSLLSMFDGEDLEWREGTLHYDAFRPRHDRPEEYALRTARWKYLCNTSEDGGEALFDLLTDPDERVDLAGSPEFDAVLDELRDALAEEMHALEVPQPWIDEAAAVTTRAGE